MDKTVIVGDCRQVMKSLPEGSIDLIVTSPPYNIDLRGAAWDDNMSWEDYTSFTTEWLTESFRVLGSGRYCCVNVGFMTYKAKRNLVFGHTKIARDIGFQEQEVIVWQKTVRGGDRNLRGKYGDKNKVQFTHVEELKRLNEDLQDDPKYWEKLSSDDIVHLLKSSLKFRKIIIGRL